MSTTYTPHKNLTLIRHGEAHSAKPGTPDFNRTLSVNGAQEASLIGTHLKRQGVRFNKIYSSPAVRALLTARQIAKSMGIEYNIIITRKGLYSESARQLLDFISSFANNDLHNAIVGHNPSLSELVEITTGKSLGSVPTCGCIQICFKAESWLDIVHTTGQIRQFDTPARLAIQN